MNTAAHLEQSRDGCHNKAVRQNGLPCSDLPPEQASLRQVCANCRRPPHRDRSLGEVRDRIRETPRNCYDSSTQLLPSIGLRPIMAKHLAPKTSHLRSWEALGKRPGGSFI